MEKIRLGKTNMMVTRLGFGSIPIQRLSEKDAMVVIKRCLELGINYIDTANGYTTSEERIGKVVTGQRDKVIIATKSQARTRERIAGHLELSLKRLNTDYIDLYQFHNVSDTDSLNAILDSDGPRAVVEEAKRAGVIKHIGVTTHTMDIAKTLIKSGYFETIMFPFNFMTNEAEKELFPLVKERDMGFIVMKPLSGGMITNASLSFKYLWQFSDIVTIPGIEKVAEIEEIVKIIDGSLEMTESEKKEMVRWKKELGDRFCRRCDYCQPCTMGIPISAIMHAAGTLKRTPPSVYLKMLGEPMEKAANCIKCGECETRCPYHLPIRDMIEENVKLFQEAKKNYSASK